MSDQRSARLELPVYVSHKRVRAGRIVSRSGNSLVLQLPSGRRLTVDVAPGLFSRYAPVAGDYLVVYGDGYESISPAKAFDDGYALDRPSAVRSP